MIYEAVNKSKNPERTVEFSKMKCLNPETEYEDFDLMQNIKNMENVDEEYHENEHRKLDCNQQLELPQP